jgi:PAS domain S-box-containing protein
VTAFPVKTAPDRSLGVGVIAEDVTEREAAAAALRDGEATLRAFYDNSPLCMGIVELTGDDIRHVYDNQATCRFFGVPDGGTTGRPASTLGADRRTLDTWRENYLRSAATGRPVQFDYTFDAPDGTRWLSVTVSPIDTGSAVPSRYCYVAEDVTERQRAEREVRQSEARFRTLAAAVPQIVWVTRPDGYHEYYNAKWYEYTGLTEDQSVGWGWSGPLHPDDKARAEARWRHSTETGEEYDIEYRFRGAGGEYRWFLGRALPQHDETGRIVRWFGTCTDIHDAKLAEEQIRLLNAELSARMGELQLILDVAPVAIWIAHDPDCRSVTGNRTSYEMLRTPVGEEVTATGPAAARRRFTEHRGGVPVPPLELPLQVAARGGVKVEGAELEMVFDDGEVRYIYGNASPVLDPDGSPGGAVAAFIDVTDQKRTAAALRERDAEFRTMAESIPPLAWMARPDGHIFWYNKRWYDYTGTTPEQMEGWGWKAVHDPEVLPAVVERWTHSIATGEPFDMTFPLKGADGRFRQFLTRVYPSKEDGRVVRWFGTNTDITDQLEAAERLRASEERFRTLTEAVPNIVWNADADGHPTYFNTRWTEYTGIALDDLQSVGRLGWVIAVHPEDHDRVRGAWEDTVTNVAAGRGDRFTHELRLRHGWSGDYRWFLTVAAPLRRPDGTIDQWIGSMADVHDQKTASEVVRAAAARFRTLTEAVPQMVWTAAADGRVTYFNTRWDEFTGLPLATYGGPGWERLVHPDDSTRLDTSWKLAVAQGADRYTQEFRLRRAADGEYRWMLSTAVPLRTPAGGVAEWVGSLTDIDDQKRQAETLERMVRDRTAQLERANLELVEEVAERKRAEQRAEATALELERSNKELEKFAYIASHDLQEPLRKIQSFGDLLRTKCRDALPAAGREYTDKMLSSAGRMRRLIDDLLSFSRVTTQGKPFARVNLTDLVAQVVADLDVRIEQTGGAVDVGELGEIDADPSQMRQLFQNLLVNALKFHKPGTPPAVRVRAERVPAAAGDPERLRVSVEDDGIGFDEKYRDRIFQVFQRLHGREEYEGTGVGLAICLKIAERHGGAISARGQIGKGATFVVTLPTHQPTKDQPSDE